MFPTGQQYNAMRGVIAAARKALDAERDADLRRILSQEIADSVGYLDGLFLAASAARNGEG